MWSGIQPHYQALNPPDYGWKFIVGVPMWYNGLQLPTQVEIRIHQEKKYENSAGNSFENKKKVLEIIIRY